MLSDRITPPRPKFERWLENLKPKHHAIVMDWLTHPELYTANAITRAIRDDDPDDDYTGYKAGHDTIINWRAENGIG